MNAPILNSLLRVDGVSLELQPPFEKPNDALDVWVYELPTLNQDLSAWCKQASEILSFESDLLKELASTGCSITLFIEPSKSSSSLRFPHQFLSLLADMKVSLEIYSP
jgi:hypothetical protein